MSEAIFQYTEDQLTMVMRSWGLREKPPIGNQKVSVSFPDEILDNAVISVSKETTPDGKALYDVVMSSSKEDNSLLADSPPAAVQKIKLSSYTWGEYLVAPTEDQNIPLTPRATEIKQSVIAAMQPAEEIGGPEDEDYLNLMKSLHQEVRKRLGNFLAWWLPKQSQEYVQQFKDQENGEPSNDKRSARIDLVIKTYQATLGENPDIEDGHDEYEIGSLLTDVRHWCDKNEVDFYKSSEISYTNYLEEKPHNAQALKQ